jgi:hypothetical protein
MAGVQWNLLQQPAPQPPINILDSFHQGVGQMQKMRMNELALAKGAQELEYNPQKLYSQILERQSKVGLNDAKANQTLVKTQVDAGSLAAQLADEASKAPDEALLAKAHEGAERVGMARGVPPEQIQAEKDRLTQQHAMEGPAAFRQYLFQQSLKNKELLAQKNAEVGQAQKDRALGQGDVKLDQGWVGLSQGQQKVDVAKGQLGVSQQNADTMKQKADQALTVQEIGANRPYVANLMANGWMPTGRMTKPMLDAVEAAAAKADKDGLPFDPDAVRAYEFQAQKNTSLGRTAGSRLVTARKENIDTAQMLLGRMQETAKELNFSDFKIAGIAEKFVKGQLNDPVLTRYMTQRADALFALGNALKQNGITDKAIQVEEEAANPTVSPKAFDAWYRVQMEALKDAGAALKKDYEPMMPNRQQVAAPPQTTGPKQIASDDDYNALPSGTEFIAPDGSRRRKP